MFYDILSHLWDHLKTFYEQTRAPSIPVPYLPGAAPVVLSLDEWVMTIDFLKTLSLTIVSTYIRLLIKKKNYL